MAFGEITSEKQRSVTLPKNFKCRVCNRFKEPGLYSNKEINIFRYKYSLGGTPTSISAELRCRECAGSGEHELKCKYCGVTKELSQFSKAARKINSSGWCKACQHWCSAAESGLVPQAAPFSELAPDEIDQTSQPTHNTNGNDNNDYYSDPEGGDDDEYDTYSAAPAVPAYISAPAQGHTTSSWAPSASSIAPSTSAMSQISVSNSGWTAPNSHSGNLGNIAGNMAPRQTSDIRSVSSASNPYEQASTTPSTNGWGDVGSSGRANTSNNAWDANGVDWIHKKFFDNRSEVGSTITTTSTTTPRPAAPRATSSSSWAKPVGKKSQPIAYNALEHQPGHRQNKNKDEFFGDM